MGIINFDYLNSVTGGDQEMLKQVLNAYTQHLPGDLQELKKLVIAGDYPNAGLLAHKIKSSARILGLESAEWLADIERTAKNNSGTDIIPERLVASEANLNLALAEIEAILNS